MAWKVENGVTKECWNKRSPRVQVTGGGRFCAQGPESSGRFEADSIVDERIGIHRVVINLGAGPRQVKFQLSGNGSRTTPFQIRAIPVSKNGSNFVGALAEIQ